MTAYTKNTPGAPTSGFWLLGDTITDSTGVVWECIKAGPPDYNIPGASFLGTKRSDSSTEAVPTSINTAGNVTLTAAQILTGIIVRDTNGGARSDTLPTAALLVAAITNPQVGDVLSCTLIGGGAAIWTILIGAGGAFDAAQLAAQQIVGVGQSKVMRIRLTNVTAASESYVAYL